MQCRRMESTSPYRDELRAAYERIASLEADRVACPQCTRRRRAWSVIANLFTLVAIVFGSIAAMIVFGVVLVVVSMGGMGFGIGLVN